MTKSLKESQSFDIVSGKEFGREIGSGADGQV